MSSANRSVFITGANGFVGSWVARRLVEEGARVVALVRDPVPEGGLRLQGIEPRVTVIRGDLADLGLLHRVLAEHEEVEECFHLAAQAIVGVAGRSPVATFASNVQGTVNLFEACRQVGVETVVMASTDKAYGTAAELPYRESSPLLATAPYEASKVCSEIVARSFACTYGLRVAVARCANVYGGGDLNFSRLIPDTIRAALAGRPPVLRSDGTPRRDYLYAADAAAAYLVLAEHGRSGLEPGQMEVFNFGRGIGVSALELAQAVLRAVGREDLEVDIRGRGKASHEIQDQYLDSTLARERLGWVPRVTLEEGLARTVAWYRGHLRAEAGRFPAGAGAEVAG